MWTKLREADCQSADRLPACPTLARPNSSISLPESSERESRTDLELPARRGRFRNRAELRRIHKPVRSPQVHLIEAIKSFQSNLKASGFGNRKISRDGEI